VEVVNPVSSLSLSRRIHHYTSSLRRKYRNKFQLDRKYKVGNSVLLMPAEHLLPEHQSENPLYDRFLPFLSSMLPEDSIVLDVGANVGDSLASMVALNAELTYVCVEGDAKFYSFLERNVEHLKDVYPNLKVRLKKGIISTTSSKKILVGSDGTRRAEINEELGISPITLDYLCKTEKYKNISLIKSDVDGWDWDVISSAFDIIQRDSPIIYFEMWVTSHDGLSAYTKMISQLTNLGYSHFYIFDCFGALIFETEESNLITSFGEYLLSQHRSETTRTLFYIDIMCGVGNSQIMKESINKYLSWITFNNLPKHAKEF
jgi:FkbM family methyltransferase